MPIEGTWEIEPAVSAGPAGLFIEAFDGMSFVRQTGNPMSLGQLNIAVVRAGTLRGIHFSDPPSRQTKYVTCAAGAVWNVVVDLRSPSPTFGTWQGTLLDDQSRRAVYLGEGIGHGYLCLDDSSVLAYACSEPHVEGRSRRIHPLDPDLGIPWPAHGRNGTGISAVIGTRDSAAPAFRETFPTKL
jgi:dTDP-4-dehydrorhamnose 3,5-epimerase